MWKRFLSRLRKLVVSCRDVKSVCDLFGPCRSASAAPVRLLLGGGLGSVHVQLPSPTNPGRSVGGGIERCPDEGSAVASYRQQAR